MQGQSPPAAFRGAKKGGAEEEGEEAEEQEEDGGGHDIMDLLPRTDIRLIEINIYYLHTINPCNVLHATVFVYFHYTFVYIYQT